MDDPVSAAPLADPTTPAPAPVDPKDIVDHFKEAVSASVRHRRTFHAEWKNNVERRLGRPIAGLIDDPNGDGQPPINPDWSLTKTKTANLYSQVPTVQATHEQPKYAPAIPPFIKQLNYELGEKRAHVGVGMEEVLNDNVNASGIGGILTSYLARFETVDLPQEDSIPGPAGPVQTSTLPSDTIAALAQAGLIHLVPTARKVSDKFAMTRVSPSDLLWPADFTGSDFNDGDWVGHDWRASWADAKHEYKLTDDQKELVVGGEEPRSQDRLTDTDDRTRSRAKDQVSGRTIYYWRHRVDPDELSFSAIWKLVLVNGLDEPAIHEPWTGQRYDPERRTYTGSCKFPLQFLTLTYVSDHPVPPSDSSAGRPQVLDMQRSRSQMFQNRRHSMPIRWYNTDRVDTLIQQQIRDGLFQGWMPIQGDGSRAVGEIARASYPSEDFTFDQQVKVDLNESWQIGPNQAGTTGNSDQTAKEAGIVQQNFSTRIGQERARVATFFLNCVEVLAGLMALYSDFSILSDEERKAMEQAWDRQHILHDLVFKIRPDSTIVLDTTQRIARLMQFLNMTVKSGFVNPKPIIAEIAELSGLDPSQVMIDPQPKPEEPNISYRFSGKDDLINPLVMAMLVELGKAPSMESLQKAQHVLTAAQMPPAPSAQTPEAGPAAGPPPQGGPPPSPPTDGAHPDWHLSSKIAQRGRDVNSGL